MDKIKFQDIVIEEINTANYIGDINSIILELEDLIDKATERKDLLNKTDKQKLQRKIINNISYDDIFDESRIKSIINYFLSNKNGVRNVSIFLLCLFYGTTRSDIVELKWEQIDFNENRIFLVDVWKPLFAPVEKILKELYLQKPLENHNNKNYVFLKDDGQHITTNMINSVFSSIKKIDESDEKYKIYTSENIRFALAKFLFFNGIQLEEVMFLLSIKPNILFDYLTTEEITSTARKNYKNSLNKVWDDVINTINI